ncbi:MAG: hypothetical protein JW917_00895 [Ignavibacteria bacterium]|nr:hypothetical protein [Ignavibacteria bacterium]
MKKLIIILILLFNMKVFPQEHIENKSGEYISWTLLQMIPSPVFFDDHNESDSRLRFGLRWQITPVNISFSSNEYVSPVQFFKISPVRRFAGSAEIFVQPEVATGSFQYSDLNKFGLNIGSRLILPLVERGEDLAFSLGGRYTLRNSKADTDNSHFGIEAGLYFIGGIFGIQYTRNFNADSNYDFGLFFKFF